VHVTRADLNHEQAAQALQGHCAVDVEEVRAEHRRGLRVQELPPRGVGVPFGRRRDLQRFEDPADRGCADPVAELEQLTLDSLVSPAVVLGGESLNGRRDLGADWRPSCPVRVGPLSAVQAAVPPQDGAGGDQLVHPRPSGQETDLRGEDRPVGPVKPGPGIGTAQHGNLVPQHEQFRVLGGGRAAEQDQPAAEPDEDEVEQSGGHGRSSCPMAGPRPSLQFTGQADFWHPTGDYDFYFRLYATSVRNFGHSVVISFGQDMNAAGHSWGYGNVPARVLIAAWRHIVTLFRSQGADNVTWMWTISANRPGTSPAASRWPGAPYVTWISIDGHYSHPGDTFTSIFGRTIDQVRALTLKPILVSVTSVATAAGLFSKIAGMFAGLRQYRALGLIWTAQDPRHDNHHTSATIRRQLRGHGRIPAGGLNSRRDLPCWLAAA
jgi:hypothetical protein